METMVAFLLRAFLFIVYGMAIVAIPFALFKLFRMFYLMCKPGKRNAGSGLPWWVIWPTIRH
ncbi:sensor histidine kinase [Prevotella dentalis DSM 3688]|uniref:Sensor histidine kinase n=1 Tax=Prevotella dentalis (strain ATCC 49559 / DSM 3688 / JCM 13448 / NCTC 12043 / ES 2772) TaxID=908937 RepID=F9D782_PREDD|nr:hypothetical protein [Prevotella dentalis]EGQ11448.1 sensor histidine kinase [Prevotella dentalis DSM 3688]